MVLNNGVAKHKLVHTSIAGEGMRCTPTPPLIISHCEAHFFTTCTSNERLVASQSKIKEVTFLTEKPSLEATGREILSSRAPPSPKSADGQYAPKFPVGDRVVVRREDGQLENATVRFCGRTAFFEGVVWYGVELDQANGKNDGSVKVVFLYGLKLLVDDARRIILFSSVYFCCGARHCLFWCSAHFAPPPIPTKKQHIAPRASPGRPIFSLRPILWLVRPSYEHLPARLHRSGA